MKSSSFTRLTARTVILTAAIAAIVAIPRAARAQVEVHLSAKPHDGPSGKQPGDDAPMVEATVVNGPGADVAKLTLVQTDAKGPDGKTLPVALKALPGGLKSYTQGTETIAIVVLVEGHGMYMGSEDAPDSGVFKQLGAAVDAVKDAGPPGSQGELIVYANQPVVKVPMGDLKALGGGGLGSLKDYQAITTRELIGGVNQAFADLKNAHTSRRCLIIVGDGMDTNPDAAKTQLADLKKQFDKEKIELYGVYYQTEELEGDMSVVKVLVPTVKTANAKDNIASGVAAIVASLSNRYYVTFPGYDVTNKVGFTWDKQPHTFTLKIGDDENDAGQLTMLPEWHAPTAKKGLPWLLIILGTIVGAILLLVAVKVLGKKPIAAPPPMVVQAPMAAPPPPGPPQPSAPMKTMMVNINQMDDGWPVVGWIVPLNGPNQFQTFKLGSNTVIGTGGGAHVVVNDGFMSTEHAAIVASPDGFLLKDRGSTNGCLVNDRRVSDHPLIDNDVILMGKTNFKFKSTM